MLIKNETHKIVNMSKKPKQPRLYFMYSLPILAQEQLNAPDPPPPSTVYFLKDVGWFCMVPVNGINYANLNNKVSAAVKNNSISVYLHCVKVFSDTELMIVLSTQSYHQKSITAVMQHLIDLHKLHTLIPD
jgi:hypothetical protein